MMKKNYLILLLLVVLYGCSDPVKKTQTQIMESLSSYLCAEVSLVNSTIDFVMYSNPENYWFKAGDRSETQSVVDKLQNLIEMAEAFEYNDYYMMQAKSDLSESAHKTQTKLINSYNNSGSSDYWAYQFFGDLGLMANRRADAMPPSLKKAIATMDSVARARYFITLPERIFQLEKDMIGRDKISVDQYKEIRAFTLQSVKDSLLTNIECENLEWRNDLIENIMSSFSNKYPVNDTYKYICDNQRYAGILLQFKSAPNENNCNFDDIVNIGNDWGYLFISDDDIVIKHSEYVGADTLDYQIGKFKEYGDKFICEFSRLFAYPTGINDQTPPSLEEQIKRGTMKKIKKERLELLETDCSQYLFKFIFSYELPNGNQENIPYVVKIASLEEYNSFVNDIKRIDKINNLFK